MKKPPERFMRSETNKEKVFELWGHKPINATITAHSAREAIEKFRAKHGFNPAWAESEDGDYAEPYADCEVCSKPIYEDDKYQCDSEGVFWHDECHPHHEKQP